MKNKAIIIFIVVILLIIMGILISYFLNSNRDYECISDSDCPRGICPGGSEYNRFSCNNNQCFEINYIRNPCELPQ